MSPAAGSCNLAISAGAGKPGGRRSAERRSAWWKAQELLARRAHGTAELERKLRERGFPAAEIAAALEKLTRRGLLDDEAYALALTAELFLKRGYGYYAILPRLRRRGLAAELCRRVLSDYFAGLDPDDLQRGLQRALARCRRRGDDAPRCLYERLKRRGFRSGEICLALDASGVDKDGIVGLPEDEQFL